MAAERQGWGNNHSEWFFFSFSFLITLEILSTDTKRVVVMVRGGERLSALLDHPKQCIKIPAAITFRFSYLFLILLSLLMRYLRAVIFFLPAFQSNWMIECASAIESFQFISQTTFFFDFCVLGAFRWRKNEPTQLRKRWRISTDRQMSDELTRRRGFSSSAVVVGPRLYCTYIVA